MEIRRKKKEKRIGVFLRRKRNEWDIVDHEIDKSPDSFVELKDVHLPPDVGVDLLESRVGRRWVLIKSSEDIDKLFLPAFHHQKRCVPKDLEILMRNLGSNTNTNTNNKQDQTNKTGSVSMPKA